jgi:rhodanese-related sulfurtransferase
MFQAVQRILLIFLLGASVGLLSNAISPKRIPLIAPPRKAPKPEDLVPLPQARDQWNSGSAFFLDARKPEDFAAGHIANALNLPAEDFDELFPKLAPMLPPDGAIVVYCDGTDCELSQRLADQLRERGYTNVHLLFDGWTAWRKAGFPTESNSPAK